MYETPKVVFSIFQFAPYDQGINRGKKYAEMKIGKNKVFFFYNCSKLCSIALDNDFDPSYQISEE